ncbi:MAG: hypothetical protein JW874_00140 [Spirochaetales bacterium]|nr:hypothetical protein [Spirochaetales bacterium]
MKRKTGNGKRLFFILKSIISAIKSFFMHIGSFFRKTNRVLSVRQLALPDGILLFAAMFLFSFLIIALETIQYHMLQIVTNYLTSSFIISIAMLGIALGSLVSFYLDKIRFHYIIAVSAVLTFLSVILSYYNIINIGALKYPYLMILPFFFASIIISTIFSHTHSNIIYFTNLVASAAGVIAPIILVSRFNSENSILILMCIPIVFLFLQTLRIRNLLIKLAAAAALMFFFFQFYGFISANISEPSTISSFVFEHKIISEFPAEETREYKKNYTYDFFKRVFKKEKENNIYRFSGDQYDWNRARYFLQVLGFYPRFGIGKIPLIEKRTVLKSFAAIDADIYDYEIIPAVRKKYDLYFRRNTDRKFLQMVYKKSEDGSEYVLSGDKYDRKRARYLLTELGHMETLNLNFDVRFHQRMSRAGKIYSRPNRSVLIEDNMLGRLDYCGTFYLHGNDDLDKSTDWLDMAINGSALDIIDCWRGTSHDTRVPWMENANMFIIGLSADGIVKPCKLMKNSTVSGVEIIPAIWETMQEGQFAEFAVFPYKDIKAVRGEGRSYLQNTDEKFDSIYLMNIHAEHSHICTLGPENLHTVESTKLMLNRLTDRGYVVYEEIIGEERTRLFYLKMLNTIKEGMIEMGIKEPEKHFYIYKWGFFEHSDPFHTIIIKRTPFNQEEKKILDRYFKANVDADTSYNEQMLYSPYSMIQDTDETKIITGNILEMSKIPLTMPVEVFDSWVLDRISDYTDFSYITRAYLNYGQNVSLRKNLSKEEKYHLGRILDYVKYPYRFDLSPVTDDKPFPYNVYKDKTEVCEILRTVLLLSMFIIVPLFFLVLHKKGQYKMSLTLPSLFMAITGFGYMFVEIALMQKFQHFIGAPTYSLIVVLGGLLLFSGIGSFVSKFLNRKVIVILSAFIPVLLVIMVLYLDRIFMALSGLSLTGKLFSSALLILPLTFLMGIPFPNALEVIKKYLSKEYGALMFGISGAFSTIASTSSILVTSIYGYRITFISGTAIYLIGLLLFSWIMLKPRDI